METKQLTGAWRKIDDPECAKAYPESLEFREGDFYLCAGDDDVLCGWPSGDYEMMQGDRIRMQTANDAMVAYEISAPREGVIRFVDDEGCVVEYERVGEGP